MKKNSSSTNVTVQRTHSRRTVVVVGLLACSLFTLLFLRLGDVQLVKGATYQAQADENRFFRQSLPAQRGLILDRYGDPLVWNVPQYFQLSDPKALYPVKTPISRDSALQLVASQGGEAVTTRPQRLYRYPSSLSHTVGYVGEVTAEDLQKHVELKPGMIVGKAGLELQYQNSLRGIEGEVVYEVDALGRKLRLAQTQPALPGRDLGTSIDPYLSEYVSRQLGDVLGTVMVADASNGKILALVSKPAFDPNVFSQVSESPEKEAARRQQVQQLFQDPRNLFFNRAISGAYPPGSTFKLMTALAGLEGEKLDSATQVVDEGFLKVGDFQFGNWYFRQYGRTEGAIGLQRAISRSNDIFFYKVAEWVGPTALAEFARTFGYGTRTGIELPAEARGIVPDPEWKESIRGEKWYLGNTYHFGIGQGDVLTTPIQVEQMTQALANDGLLCPLSVIAGGSDKVNQIKANTEECRQVGLSTEHLALVQQGMIDACSSSGTAFPFFSYNSQKVQPDQSTARNLANGAVACKTGTAEFGGADEQGHRNTHAWFTAFLTLPKVTASASATATAAATLPENLLKPVGELSDDELHRSWLTKSGQFGFPNKIAITVLVESDETVKFREGSADAAPIARQIVDWLTK